MVICSPVMKTTPGRVEPRGGQYRHTNGLPCQLPDRRCIARFCEIWQRYQSLWNVLAFLTKSIFETFSQTPATRGHASFRAAMLGCQLASMAR